MDNVLARPMRVDKNNTAESCHAKVEAIINALDGIILGKQRQIRLALTCLLANGHLLIEDLPGMGKTTLAHALAKVLGLDFHRVQFTSDLLPTDVIGVSVYNKDSGEFHFHKGPVFSQLVLADEVNRATPKTQSALLEAMEERQVSVDGYTHKLPEPFFVVATQNPSEQVGTFALPESQLDRFLMRIKLGYPDKKFERQLLVGDDRRQLLKQLKALIQAHEFVSLQQNISQVHVSDALLDYQQNLVEFSRTDSRLRAGLSPRASLMLLKAARTWAFVHREKAVTPAHLQTVLPSVVDHRLSFRQQTDTDTQEQVSNYLIESVAIP